jgi:hypothetical protein
MVMVNFEERRSGDMPVNDEPNLLAERGELA